MTTMPAPRRAPRRTRLLLGAAALPLAALAACGSAGPPPAQAPVGASSAPAAVALPVRGEHVTLVARPSVDTDVYAAVGDASPVTVLPARNGFGSPLALVVLDDSVPGWLEVRLPVRPNGSTGWIRSAGVEQREVDLAVHVDLAARRLVVTDGGATVLETPVAVGAPGTPTPTGEFFVVDKLDTGRPDGPYGPFAFGLSAHSDVLTEFAGGDGQVGLHGTADPSSIGNAASNGCVRLPNEVAVALEALLPLGTPVTIA
jgi:lipoprotein-anchoring transpeptidase ErfK/SrfK